MKLFDNLIKSSKIKDIKSLFADNKNSSQLKNRIECKKCSSTVDKDSTYCWKCGNELKNEETKNNVNDKNPVIFIARDIFLKKNNKVEETAKIKNKLTHFPENICKIL